jgi:hypothetical protein
VLVGTRVKERPIVLQEAKTYGDRALQKVDELAIASEIFESTSCRDERRELWMAKTGKSEQTLYRRLALLTEREGNSQ